MRQRMGMVISVAGVLLLLGPGVNYTKAIYGVMELLRQNWPLLLIVLGLFLMRPGKKGRHT